MVADRSHDGLYMTVEQYFALDEATDGKYEYIDGYAYLLRPPSSAYANDMSNLAGGSPAHALISMNIGRILGNALEEGPCAVYSSDAKVKVTEKRYLYPDVTVVCGEQEDVTYITTPTIVVEVLSPTTEAYDRGAKFKTYKTLRSLQEYVLIGSQYKEIEVYRREDAFWKQYSYQEGDTVELASIGVSFPFDQAYRHVHFR